jgi:hypothetical protein
MIDVNKKHSGVSMEVKVEKRPRCGALFPPQHPCVRIGTVDQAEIYPNCLLQSIKSQKLFIAYSRVSGKL